MFHWDIYQPLVWVVSCSPQKSGTQKLPRFSQHSLCRPCRGRKFFSVYIDVEGNRRDAVAQTSCRVPIVGGATCPTQEMIIKSFPTATGAVGNSEIAMISRSVTLKRGFFTTINLCANESLLNQYTQKPWWNALPVGFSHEGWCTQGEWSLSAKTLSMLGQFST